MNEASGDLIKYRLDRASEAWEEAGFLAEKRRWNSCVNRLYYSCFYAVSALLFVHNMSSSKHAGVLSLFNLHFVKSGKVPKGIAEVYNDLFDSRQEGDYTDFVRFSEEETAPYIERTRLFLSQIESLIHGARSN